MRTIIVLLWEERTKREESYREAWKHWSKWALLRISNYAQRLCFKSHIALERLHTWLGLSKSIKLNGCCIKIISWMSSWRKTSWMSIYLMSQPYDREIERISQIVVGRITRLKVSKKLTPWWNPLVTRRALYCSRESSTLHFDFEHSFTINHIGWRTEEQTCMFDLQGEWNVLYSRP
jgi:hypothetical protein